MRNFVYVLVLILEMHSSSVKRLTATNNYFIKYFILFLHNYEYNIELQFEIHTQSKSSCHSQRFCIT